MENANTYRAILLGTTLLFAGCLTWLLISRNEISSTNTALDQSKLKYEALLSEKLLAEKKLEKTAKKLDTVQYQNNLLTQSLESKFQQISAGDATNRSLKKSLRVANEKHHQATIASRSLNEQLQKTSELNSKMTTRANNQRDSISALQQQVTVLRTQYEDAFRRSIDQTLITAERKNDKITSKAKRTTELVAQVDLPVALNNLSFTVEGPDGSVLSTDATLTARQLAKENSLTASLSSLNLPTTSIATKKMEIIYKPAKKLTEGLYVFKIFNGADYVGSMNVKLR
jgi:hypothetical protein